MRGPVAVAVAIGLLLPRERDRLPAPAGDAHLLRALALRPDPRRLVRLRGDGPHLARVDRVLLAHAAAPGLLGARLHVPPTEVHALHEHAVAVLEEAEDLPPLPAVGSRDHLHRVAFPQSHGFTPPPPRGTRSS